jgi:hypothetical protein
MAAIMLLIGWVNILAAFTLGLLFGFSQRPHLAMEQPPS